MRPTVVIDVVGLTRSLIGEHTPNLARLEREGASRPMRAVTPAVTCSAQATFTTGRLPRDHGIVGNGWYFAEQSEIWFWRQSNRLVTGEMIWDAARKRDDRFTVAKLFWWYNMYSSADISVTPRPMYPADGRKIPDIYTHPAGLRRELTDTLGGFPLFNFWGPTADIVSSRWITDCALHVMKTRDPTLTLVYLPHLDYNLQRIGPHPMSVAKDLRDVDALCGELIEAARRRGARVMVLSEYGITSVGGAVMLNRILRREGLIAIREELGRELLDPGASEAFAVCDHQIAHVYVARPELVEPVAQLIRSTKGVDAVYTGRQLEALGLDHPRSGDVVAVSKADSWFCYYHWFDDDRAPDFARTVDIHRKPGYDPVELFLDPTLPAPKLSVAWRLLKKFAGFRYLMDVIPLEPRLVRGSHGRPTDDPEEGPVVISSDAELLPRGTVDATAVKDLVLGHLFD